MDVVVPTVPHTGTMFVVHLFLEQSYNQRSLADGREEWPDKSVFSGHLVKPERVADAVYLCERVPCIVPLRHPYLVAESWRLRWKEISNLLDAFYHLIEFIDPFDPIYLPMDVPGRDDYFHEMNRRLGMELPMKWNVVNSKHNTFDLTWKDVKPSETTMMLAMALRPFLERFYGKNPVF